MANAVPYGPPLLLEKPLEEFTTPELERLVVRNAHLDWRWQRGVTSLPRTRPVSSRAGNEGFLIEGGRWYFECSHDGSGHVWYYDLDAEPVTERLLLKLEGIEGADVQEAAWNIDGRARRLSLVLALRYGTRGQLLVDCCF